MTCNACSSNAMTVTSWDDNQPEQGQPDIYSVWRCEKGHHFFTLSKWQGEGYTTDFIDPKDMQSVRHFQ